MKPNFIVSTYLNIPGHRIQDLGYRNSSYNLKVDGIFYRFPTIDEAYEFLDELQDSDE